jgi:hypothetical protein
MRQKKTKERRNTRLKMGVSTETQRLSTLRLQQEGHAGEDGEGEGEGEGGGEAGQGDPADILMQDLLSSVQQVAPPLLAMLANNLSAAASSGGVSGAAALEQLRQTKQLDADRIAAGVEENEGQQAKRHWRDAGRSVVERRGDFAIRRPKGGGGSGRRSGYRESEGEGGSYDDADLEGGNTRGGGEQSEAERLEMLALRHFPRSLRQWSNALALLEAHGARVSEEEQSGTLVEQVRTPPCFPF